MRDILRYIACRLGYHSGYVQGGEYKCFHCSYKVKNNQ